MITTDNFESVLNAIISSTLFKNSGRNICLRASDACSFAAVLLSAAKPIPVPFAEVPAFDVIIITVFSKFTVLP